MGHKINFDIKWTKAGRSGRLKMHTTVTPIGNSIKLLVCHGAYGWTHTFKSMEG